MDCVLHVSYRLEVIKWMKRMNDEEKAVVKKKKEKVISNFKSQNALFIDSLKIGGGNTNEGNTASRFFPSTETSSRKTGVDKTLSMRIGVILKTVACRQRINVSDFHEYTSDTVKLYMGVCTTGTKCITRFRHLLSPMEDKNT